MSSLLPVTNQKHSSSKEQLSQCYSGRRASWQSIVKKIQVAHRLLNTAHLESLLKSSPVGGVDNADLTS